MALTSPINQISSPVQQAQRHFGSVCDGMGHFVEENRPRPPFSGRMHRAKERPNFA